MIDGINIRPITTGKIIPEISGSKNNSNANLGVSKSFSDILDNEVYNDSQMKFSSHALKRMQERSITLSENELGKLKNAVSKAKDKGIRESLVVMRDIALIINIPNKTVITAVDGKNLKENIFTNIDGAMFI